MFFEPPTQVRRDSDIECPSIRTRRDIDHRSSSHLVSIGETLPRSGKVSPLGPSALGRDDGRGYSGLNPDSFRSAVFTSTSLLMKAAKSLGPRAVGTMPSDVVLSRKPG